MTSTPPASSHPDTERLRAFALGLLPPQDIAAVADHVGGCPLCQQLVDSQPTDWLLGLARNAAREPGPATGMPFSDGNASSSPDASQASSHSLT